MNKIQTSTACIGNFVYHGTYDTHLGEHLSGVPYDARAEVDAEIGKIYVEILTDAIDDIFRDFDLFYDSDIDSDFAIEYVDTYHPHYYNFETDSIIFDFKYSDGLRDWMFDYAVTNAEKFKKFLFDNFTSRDGFYSFTSNNWSDWESGWNDGDWRCVSALLQFIMEQEIAEYDRDNYWYDFNERAEEIISEQYTPWEWAERFESGLVAVVKGDWDDDKQATIYNAYLIDDSGNVVNRASLADEYDEEFHQSAFAVFAYSDLVSDMMGRYESSTPCDVPTFDAA